MYQMKIIIISVSKIIVNDAVMAVDAMDMDSAPAKASFWSIYNTILKKLFIYLF